MKKEKSGLRALLLEKTRDFVKNADGLGIDAHLLEVEIAAVTRIDPAIFDEKADESLFRQFDILIDIIEFLDQNLRYQLLVTTRQSEFMQLLKFVADLGRQVGNAERAKCMNAAYCKDEVRLQALIEAGCNVNHPLSNGETLLEWALSFNFLKIDEQKSMIQILLRNGAEITEGLAHRCSNPQLRAVLEAEVLRRAVKDETAVTSRIARRS